MSSEPHLPEYDGKKLYLISGTQKEHILCNSFGYDYKFTCMLWGCVKVQEHICVASFPVARSMKFANVVLQATNAQGPAAGMRLCLCVDLHKIICTCNFVLVGTNLYCFKK